MFRFDVHFFFLERAKSRSNYDMKCIFIVDNKSLNKAIDSRKHICVCFNFFVTLTYINLILDTLIWHFKTFFWCACMWLYSSIEMLTNCNQCGWTYDPVQMIRIFLWMAAVRVNVYGQKFKQKSTSAYNSSPFVVHMCRNAIQMLTRDI